MLVLAVAGGAIGILLSVFGMRWFTAALSVNPPPFWITFELDYRVLLFVLALIVLASLLAGGAAGDARLARQCRSRAEGRQPVLDQRHAWAGSAAAW